MSQKPIILMSQKVRFLMSQKLIILISQKVRFSMSQKLIVLMSQKVRFLMLQNLNFPMFQRLSFWISQKTNFLTSQKLSLNKKFVASSEFFNTQHVISGVQLWWSRLFYNLRKEDRPRSCCGNEKMTCKSYGKELDGLLF